MGQNLTKSGQMSIPNRGAGRRVHTHQRRRALCVRTCAQHKRPIDTEPSFSPIASARSRSVTGGIVLPAQLKSACDQFLRGETVPFLFSLLLESATTFGIFAEGTRTRASTA